MNIEGKPVPLYLCYFFDIQKHVCYTFKASFKYYQDFKPYQAEDALLIFGNEGSGIYLLPLNSCNMLDDDDLKFNDIKFPNKPVFIDKTDSDNIEIFQILSENK